MKLYELADINDFDPKKAASFIVEHCQPFLQAINYQAPNYVMYRGLRVDKLQQIPFKHADIYEMNGHNPGRTPVDTPKVVHKNINQIFTNQFGTPFRDGVFVSGAISVAFGYGDMVGRIIPVGEFKYLWSPVVRDLYTQYNDFIYEAKQANGNKKPWTEVVDSVISDFYHKIAHEYEYKDTDLLTAIKSRHEVMLYCDKCIMFRTDKDYKLADAVFQAIQQIKQ